MPPAPTLAAFASHRRTLSVRTDPVRALRAFLHEGAALLESRTDHPGARVSILGTRPVAELTLHRDHALRTDANGATRRWDDPLQALEQAIAETSRGPTSDVPFAGGWIGLLHHELAHLLLRTPVPPAAPPSRPQFPLAHLRLYADALVFDRATGGTEAFVNELAGPVDVQARFREIERRLHEPLAPAAPPTCVPRPVTSLDPDAFQARVREIQDLVRAGDCFQVNLTSSQAFPWTAPPSGQGLVSLYNAYAASNPGPWGGFYAAPYATVLSGSPELLFEARNGRLRLRPIAGTRARGPDAATDRGQADALRTDEKERAEHAMLVDLARNDAAQVCRPGTVHVPNLGGVERYRHVMHLVSEVEGEIRPEATFLDLVRAVFPGGTVTGAPKRRAVERIAELEGGPRGPYTGALGYVSLDGSTQWNLLIRSLVATPSHLVAHAGCGIVEGSRPANEAAELAAKALAQVDAALGRSTPAPAWLRCGDVEPGPPWRPADVAPRGSGRDVLLVDFDDSFVHNLADYCRRLGARTRVVGAREDAQTAWREPPTHLVLSPGPGRPEDFPQWREHLAKAQRHGVPVLGVCLGHQAIAQHLGAEIVRHPVTVHGRSSRVRRTPAAAADPLLREWSGASAARYHSLVARALPSTIEPLAVLEDGTCMAMRVRDRPWWGLQFHPESLLTPDGARLLAAFLEVGRDG